MHRLEQVLVQAKGLVQLLETMADEAEKNSPSHICGAEQDPPGEVVKGRAEAAKLADEVWPT